MLKYLTKQFSRIIGATCLVAVALAAQAEGDPEKGKAHFQLCIACHGPNGGGNKILNAPSTAGQHEFYLVRQIANFKAGIRGSDPKDVYGAQMRPMAMSLPDDQAIADVAAYIATLPKPATETTVVGDAAAGEKLFTTCLACHGANGQGIVELNAPRIAGLNDWYLVRQLQNFQAGLRGVHPKDLFGTQMQAMSQLLLDDQQINDVVAHIGTLDD